MLELFQYGFIVRGLIAGLLIGAIAPLIGIFLVLRRYSLIADTLSHVSFAGIAIGLLLKINPALTALGAASIASVAIERLRGSKKIYGESALSIFLSGSLALAIVLIGLGHGFGADLFSYLFGSILTVRPGDIYTIVILGLVVVLAIAAFYKELVFISFDEETAAVSGIPVRALNTLFILLSATTIAITIPVIGVLLVSALLVVPVVTALQFKKSFRTTLGLAEVISLGSVIFGVIASFYLNVSAGGLIVLIMLAVFAAVLAVRAYPQICRHYRSSSKN